MPNGSSRIKRKGVNGCPPLFYNNKLENKFGFNLISDIAEKRIISTRLINRSDYFNNIIFRCNVKDSAVSRLT